MEKDFIFSLYLATRLFGHQLVKIFAGAGYRFKQEHFLIFLLLSDGKKKGQKDIVQDTIKSKATITRAIDQLVKRGFVRREFDYNDRRHNTISLTEKGMSMYHELLRFYLLVEDDFLKGVDRHDLECCFRVFSRIIVNIKG